MLEGQLDALSAAALADDYFDASASHALSLTITVEGAMRLEDLSGSPPRYTVQARGYAIDPARIFRLVSAEIDHVKDRTTLVVRG